MDNETIIKLLGASTAIVLAVLAWLRYRPKDRVEVEKISAETRKVNAEADKVRSDAEMSASTAAKTINDIAMGIINRLDDELTHEKESNTQLQQKLSELLAEIRTLQRQLDERTKHCDSLSKELELARIEIQNLRKQ